MKQLTIIGGGLSGLGLANGLLKSGVPVRVVEAGFYPRHRVCGEFLTALDQGTLNDLGIPDCMEKAILHRTTGWFRHGRKIATLELPEPALGISRYCLDAHMVQAARDKGGSVAEGTHGSTNETEGAIVATGRKPAKQGMIGLKAHWSNLQIEEDLELHLGQHAYVGLSRVEDGFVNACGIFREIAVGKFKDPVERFHQTLKINRLSELSDKLMQGTYRKNSFCSVSGLNYRYRSNSGIGDYREMIPPFTGNGMTIALESAKLVLPLALEYANGQIGWDAFLNYREAALRNYFNKRYSYAKRMHPLILNPVGQKFAALASALKLLPFNFLYQLTHS